MAIRIPSKHIYDIDNQKVIDNVIDNVEVHIKAPQLISATENVYNESVSSGFATGTAQDNQKYAYITKTQTYGNSGYAYSYVQITPTYLTKTFIVPKSVQNSRVLRLFTGADNNGQSNIKCSFRGTVKKGTATATANLTIAESWNTEVRQYYISNIAVQKTSIIPTTKTEDKEKQYSFTKDDLEISNYVTNAEVASAEGDNLRATTATITLVSEDSLLTATAKENDNDYTITLTILCGLKKIALGAIGGNEFPYYNSVGTYSVSCNYNNTYEEYIPKQVDMSFYGDVIKLDLVDEILTIGNGDNIISFAGNELFQKTNKPSVEETYTKVISEYVNGKEIATIRCGIEDYYDTDGNLAISKNRKDNLPMTFHIGDRVIPYIYGSNGIDRPMSTKKDNSPKEFEVIGKGITYDGAIFQKLTLQEYRYVITTTVTKRVATGNAQVIIDGTIYYEGKDTITFTDGEITSVSAEAELGQRASATFDKDNIITVTVLSEAPKSVVLARVKITYLGKL